MEKERVISRSWGELPSCLVSAALAVGLFCSLYGSGAVPVTTPFRFVVGSIALFALLLGAGVVCARVMRSRIAIIPGLFVLPLLGFFASPAIDQHYNFFQGPLIRGELIVALLVMLFWIRRSLALLPILPILAIAVPLYAYLRHADGAILFSDDLATFSYRLQLLKENFPRIPFYNPQWNGGIDARDFFATGSLNAFLIFSPLIASFPVFEIFNTIIITLLFGLVPLFTYWAARSSGSSRAVQLIAPALALSSGLLWYRWGIAYGTVGFTTSIAILPLVFTLAIKFLKEDLSAREAVVFVIATSLVLMWSASLLVFLPLAALALGSLPSLLRRRQCQKIMVALLAINLPWIALFLSVSNVFSFVTLKPAAVTIPRDTGLARVDDTSAPETPIQQNLPSMKAQNAQFNPLRSLRVLRESVISTNPLIPFLLIPGIALLPRGRRLAWGVTSGWLLFLGSVMVPLKPQLELDRMLIILFQLSTIPVATAIAHLFSRGIEPEKRWWSRVPALIAGMYLITGPFATGAVIENRTLVPYYFEEPVVKEMAHQIHRHSDGGRVLFSGFVLHELSNGHLAPLAIHSNTPLMASSPMHNVWTYRQIIPASFLTRGDEGIQEYLDLYNVTAVFAHERSWIQHFRDRPDRFREVWQGGRFVLFKRTNPVSSYFVQGSGSVLSQSSSEVIFRVDTPDAVIKFNHLSWLEAGDCTVTPYRAAPEVQLIRVTGCAVGTAIRLRAKHPLTRLFN